MKVKKKLMVRKLIILMAVLFFISYIVFLGWLYFSRQKNETKPKSNSYVQIPEYKLEINEERVEL